jgi:hypothetical protein
LQVRQLHRQETIGTKEGSLAHPRTKANLRHPRQPTINVVFNLGE